MARDPVARLREREGHTGIAVLPVLNGVLGAPMAIATAALGFQHFLMAALAGSGAMPAVYRFLR